MQFHRKPMKKRNIIVTPALPYANAPLHIGHLLEHTQAHIWHLFQKLRGHNCKFICGSDSHELPLC
jgi:methionyl-tRNA synthetase